MYLCTRYTFVRVLCVTIWEKNQNVTNLIRYTYVRVHIFVTIMQVR